MYVCVCVCVCVYFTCIISMYLYLLQNNCVAIFEYSVTKRY